MLTRLYIDNFKAFVNFELASKPLNLLLGANGSGKSSTFEILRLLQKFIGGSAASELFPLNTLLNCSCEDDLTFCRLFCLPSLQVGCTELQRL